MAFGDDGCELSLGHPVGHNAQAMLPVSFQLPAAIVLLAGGLLACFLGYRLFRLVLAIYGFALGALIATSALGLDGTWVMVLAAVVGGLVGATILMVAYFVGVALVGAGLATLLAHLIWTQIGSEPHPLVVIGCAVVGALVALLLQRYVIIGSTAFGGAWTAIVGGLALTGDRGAAAAAQDGDGWVWYLLQPAPGQEWVILAWVVTGLTGLIVQLAITGKDKKKKGR